MELNYQSWPLYSNLLMCEKMCCFVVSYWADVRSRCPSQSSSQYKRVHHPDASTARTAVCLLITLIIKINDNTSSLCVLEEHGSCTGIVELESVLRNMFWPFCQWNAQMSVSPPSPRTAWCWCSPEVSAVWPTAPGAARTHSLPHDPCSVEVCLLKRRRIRILTDETAL